LSDAVEGEAVGEKVGTEVFVVVLMVKEGKIIRIG